MEASIIRKLSISESDFSHSEHESYSHGFMTTVAGISLQYFKK
jgi:hypothetical protein